MPLLKSRPTIRLRMPSEVRPGERFEATVLLDARRPVTIAGCRLELLATEGWS